MNNKDVIPGFEDAGKITSSQWRVREIEGYSLIRVYVRKIGTKKDAIYLILEGELEAANAGRLAERLGKSIENGVKSILIDLNRANLGDYRETLFVSAAKQLTSIEGILIVISPPENLLKYWRDILGISNEMINKMFYICSDYKKAEDKWNSIMISDVNTRTI